MRQDGWTIGRGHDQIFWAMGWGAARGRRPPAALPGTLMSSQRPDDVGAMRFNPQANLLRVVGRRKGRRLSGRLPQEGLYCNLGAVIDLSAGGIRLFCKRFWDDETNVILSGYDVSVSIRAKVAWSHRHGFRRHEIGLMFLDVDEEMSRMLTRVSMMHRKRRAI